MAERRADGAATEEEQALEDDFATAEWDRTNDYSSSAYAYGTEAVTLLCHQKGYEAAAGVAEQASHAAASARLSSLKAETAAQSNLLREIFGNPFCPTMASPAWQTANVVSLAQAIYDERDFSRMQILGDALEDAGCNNADILHHCRQSGEHVRGCWVIDLLLGKS